MAVLTVVFLFYVFCACAFFEWLSLVVFQRPLPSTIVDIRRGLL